MSDPPATSSRDLWDSRYAGMQEAGIQLKTDDWLDRWTSVWSEHSGGRVLDLGCGTGIDSGQLTRRGLRVISTDQSRTALHIAQREGLIAGRQTVLDLSRGLPFTDGSFDVVVANLSLHYFAWSATMQIMQDIRRCLQPGGYALVRVNSTDDVAHGSQGHRQIEPGLFSVKGNNKRFFTEQSARALFDDGWRVLDVSHQSTQRYRAVKMLWEIGAQVSPGHE